MKSDTIKNKSSFFSARPVVFALSLFFSTACFSQYNVTEIITDYGGYWKSSAASINSVKPDNSHNLVSFSFNGNRYSTGVNDALLTSQGQSFIAGDYKALPMTSLGSAVTSNTKIGLGYMYDGNANGPSSPAPKNDISYYLSDGIKGLDLGTCVANLPAGTLNFPVSNILPSALGDNIPDILITQIADPSGSSDRYQFTDINGAVVGNPVDIVLTNIPPVGNWTADFYEASQSPMTLAGGFTKTDRPIRIWATDLSAFGINSSNSSRVAYFKIILSGNSDVAFVSYNASAINLIGALLPVQLNNFTGKAVNSQVDLSWETSTEMNSGSFIVERSTDGSSFAAIASIKAGGSTSATSYYKYADKNPSTAKNYYRLKMLDNDGAFSYSKTIVVNGPVGITGITGFYPNPAKGYIVINHSFAGNDEQLQIISLQGIAVLQQKIIAGSFQTRIELAGFEKGTYQLVWTNGKELSGRKLMVL